MRVCIVGASGKLGRYMVQPRSTVAITLLACRERSVAKLDLFRGRITVADERPGRYQSERSLDATGCSPCRSRGAFEHLDRAIEGHDPALVHLAVAPQWDSLRVDPRFNQRLARMGLAPALRHQN